MSTGLMSMDLIHNLVSAKAKSNPDAIAISFLSSELTYEELEKASTLIANRLRVKGVRNGDIIPVLTTRCLECIACFLGVLKAGACYVPIEIDTWSQSRIEKCLDVIQPSLIVTTRAGDYYSYECVSFENVHALLEEKEHHGCPLQTPGPTSSEALAYMIFTSGTTGHPKGVMIPHRALCNYVQQGDMDAPFNMRVQCSDKVLLIFSISFDAAVGVIFSTLANGGTLLISGSNEFLQEAERCTKLGATPSILQSLKDVDRFHNIRAVFLGGETPSKELISRWTAPHRQLWNCYGPTESTCCSLISELRPAQPITLGRPMVNSSVLLLAGDTEAEQGEICLSGPGLAEGYFKDPTQTAKRFKDWNGTRIYRTGDFAKTTPNGLVFLGREDNMVKVRGFLVNLDSDVLDALYSYPGVTNAVAFLEHDMILACVTPETIDTRYMRTWLEQNHERYTIPDRLLAVKELQKTSNGKIDVQAARQLHRTQSKMLNEHAIPDEEKISILLSAVADAVFTPRQDISWRSSFWEVGGTSVSAISVISRLQTQFFRISMAQLFESPDLLTASRAMSPLPQEVSHQISSIAVTVAREAPLAAVPAKLLRSLLLKPGSNYLSIVMKVNTGEGIKSVDGPTFLKAWSDTLSGYDIFTSSFDLDRNIQLKYHSSLKPNIDWNELNVLDPSLQEAIEHECRSLHDRVIAAEWSNPLRLTTFLRYFHCNGRPLAAIWMVHHSQIDGWSASSVIDDVQDVLNGCQLQQRPSYATAALTQERMAKECEASATALISEHMQTHANMTPLKLFTATLTPETNAWNHIADLGLTSSELENGSRSLGVTSAALLSLSWALVLSMYTSNDAATFGMVLNGRSLAFGSAESVIGPLINTCPLSLATNGIDKTIVLWKAQEMLFRLNDVQWGMHKALQLAPNKLVKTMFSTILALEYQIPQVRPRNESEVCLEAQRYDLEPEIGLLALVEPRDQSLQLRLLFKAGFAHRAVAAQMAALFTNTVRELLGQNRDIDDIRANVAKHALPLSVTTPIGETVTSTTNQRQHQWTVREHFTASAHQWPEGVAVEATSNAGTREMRYAELLLKANSVASSIQNDFSSSEAVGVWSDGSLEWIIATLGIVQAGHICVPIDSKLPQGRVDAIIEQAGINLVICPGHFGSLPLPAHVNVLVLNDKIYLSQQQQALNTKLVRLEDSAYIIFTSGSTGTPRGVPINHKTVMSVIYYPPARVHASPGKRIAQMFSVGFDGCIAEIFGTLCYGATLVLKDPLDHFSHLSRVDATMIPPSLLAVLDPNGYPHLDTILVAGEAVSQSTVDCWAPGRRMYNGYGPSECGFVSTIAQLEANKPVTIGRPLPGIAVYLFNRHLNPVPTMVTGEICLAGHQLSQGYLRSSSESGFISKNGEKMFRTGDLGVWNESGEVLYMGRIDNQVKIRGFRIELEEIERAVLSVEPRLTYCTAVKANDQLVCYIVPSSANSTGIRNRLKTILPHYALPSRLIASDNLPLTPNQKIDRRALIDLAITETNISKRNPAPRPKLANKTEALIQKIWIRILPGQIEDLVTADSHFLDLGGTSITQIQVAREVSSQLGLEGVFPLIMGNPVLSELASALDKRIDTPRTRADLPRRDHSTPELISEKPRSQGRDFIATSYLEKEMYKIHLSPGRSNAFNLAYRVPLDKGTDTEALKCAIDSLLEKFAILRSRYIMNHGQLYRVIEPSDHILSMTQAINGDDVPDQFLAGPFDLAQEQPIRFLLSRSHAEGLCLYMVVHHIVADRESVEILIDQLRTQLRVHDPSLFSKIGSVYTKEIGSVDFEYTEWASWSNRHLSYEETNQSLDKWRRMVSQTTQLPYSNGVAWVPSGRSSRTCTVSLNEDAPVSISHMLAASSWCLRRVLKHRDIVIAISQSLRTEPGTEKVVGLLLDRLPLPIQFESIGCDPRSALDWARSLINTVMANVLPFHILQESFGMAIDFDIMITLHHISNMPSSDESIDEPENGYIELESPSPKFPLTIEFEEISRGVLQCKMVADPELVPWEHLERLAEILPPTLQRFCI